MSCDFENGFADAPGAVATNIELVMATGLAGASVEDASKDPDAPIYDVAPAVERVAAAAEVAHAGDVKFVLTARAENYLHGRRDLDDTIARLQAFQAAGADVLYAPGITDLEEIRQVVAAVDRPVNVLALPGVPTIAELATIGVGACVGRIRVPSRRDRRGGRRGTRAARQRDVRVLGARRPRDDDLRGLRSATDAMPDVRLVTAAVLPVPDPDLGRLQRALTARTVDVDVAKWHDPTVDWSDTPVTVLRSPWDYVDRLDEFLAWVASRGTCDRVWNPPALVRWNTHKAYLLELAAPGVPVVPTVVLARGSAAALAGIADAEGWNAVVVKPAVAVGAGGAGRFDVGDGAGQEHLDALLVDGDVLVQPYVSEIEREGEVSVVMFDGRATHAVRKTPAAGDFRIHEHHGGTFARDRPRRRTDRARRTQSRRPCPRPRSMPAST